MARIFKTPFGAQGDTEQVPEAPQGDGSVSLTQGFGYDYEREYEDPAAKDIRREVMNGLFHDITEAIGDIQLSGIAKWSADAAPYPAGAVVWRSSVAWMSTTGNNNSVPGAGSWKAVDLSSSVRLSESIDQVPSANNVQEALAALGLLGTNFATAAEAQSLESLTKLISPGRLGDAMNAHVLGMEQTWQDVTGSRVEGITYTNTTGRAIAVSISVLALGASQEVNEARLFVDGLSIARYRNAPLTTGGTTTGSSGSVFSVIPAGSTYSLDIITGNPDISHWLEMR